MIAKVRCSQLQNMKLERHENKLCCTLYRNDYEFGEGKSSYLLSWVRSQGKRLYGVNMHAVRFGLKFQNNSQAIEAKDALEAAFNNGRICDIRITDEEVGPRRFLVPKHRV